MIVVKQTLLERIRRDGEIHGQVIKVDRFLNHMVDPMLMEQLGNELAGRFADRQIDKLITAESSGIMITQVVAMRLGVPFVFAKKKRPRTMGEYFAASSYSFTKDESTTLYVARDVLTPGERLLIIDDFFAAGSTYKALQQIIDEAGATLVGCAVIINKSERRDIESILTLTDLTGPGPS